MRRGTGWTRQAPQRTVMQSAYCPVCHVRIFFEPKTPRSDQYSEEPIACSPAHEKAVLDRIAALLWRWMAGQSGDRAYWRRLYDQYRELSRDYGLIDEDVALWAQEELRRSGAVEDAAVTTI